MNAAIDEVRADPVTDVEAVLYYTRDTGVRPVNYTFDPPTGVARNSGDIDARFITIRDAREAFGLGLDRSGFELLRHQSTLGDWDAFRDPVLVNEVEYPQAAAALRARTGAQKVLIFDHTLRDSSASPGRAEAREPVRRVHDDQTLQSAPGRVRRHLPEAEATWRLQRRFAIINFWRPIGGRVQQAPLAICDARTIEPEDLIPSDLVYPDWRGETYAFAFSPRHRWYWYPDQSSSEATLIKVFDSATDGRARLTAHTAFDHLRGPGTAPPRRSIELRALVFW